MAPRRTKNSIAAIESSRRQREESNHDSPLLVLPPELRNRLYYFAMPATRNLEMKFPIGSGGDIPPTSTILQLCRQIRFEAASEHYKDSSLEIAARQGMNALPYVPRSIRAMPTLSARFACTVKVTIEVLHPKTLQYWSLDREGRDGGSQSKLTLTFKLSADETYSVSTGIIKPSGITGQANPDLYGRSQSNAAKLYDMVLFAKKQAGEFEKEMMIVLASRSISPASPSFILKVFDYADEREAWEAGKVLDLDGADKV